MKRIKQIIGIFAIFMMFVTSINASSYDLSVNPENIKAKMGDTLEIEINLKDIDMGEKGINVIEGYIEYDEDVIESIEIIDENQWQMTYNNDKTSELYGKFLSKKNIEGTKGNEKIAKIKLKIKDKISKTTSQVKIKEITSNDGEKLINIGEKIVNLEFEGVNIVNTGDITLILILGIISLVLIANLILSNRKIRE